MDGQELIEKLKAVPKQDAHPFWSQACVSMIDWLEHHDPESFLDCPILRQTMVFDDEKVAQFEWDEMPDRYRNVVKIDPATGQLVNNSIHQAYHIFQWENWTQKKVEDLQTIFEFGAGYGELCRIIYQLGFEGSYVINDFIAMSLLQQFYLSDTWFLPKVFWESCYTTQAAGLPDSDLFIALWSLSETPLEFRQKFLEVQTRSYLMAYSLEFMGIDNVPFFREFAKRQFESAGIDVPIAQLHNKHRYMVGW